MLQIQKQFSLGPSFPYFLTSECRIQPKAAGRESGRKFRAGKEVVKMLFSPTPSLLLENVWVFTKLHLLLGIFSVVK